MNVLNTEEGLLSCIQMSSTEVCNVLFRWDMDWENIYIYIYIYSIVLIWFDTHTFYYFIWIQKTSKENGIQIPWEVISQDERYTGPICKEGKLALPICVYIYIYILVVGRYRR